jgi:hypothetical protein
VCAGSFGTSLLQEDCREDSSGSQAKLPNNGANCDSIARSGFIENGFGNWAGRVQLVGCLLFETSSRIQRLENIVLCRFVGMDVPVFTRPVVQYFDLLATYHTTHTY